MGPTKPVEPIKLTPDGHVPAALGPNKVVDEVEKVPNEVEEQIKLDEKRECLSIIMRDCECSLEEAEQIYNDIALNEVKETIDQLVKEGIVEVSGYNDDGEPLFTLTELGRQIQKELKNK